MPLLHETEANHDCSPDDDNRRQEDTGTELAEYDCSRGLQSNICDKEQQDDDAVSLAGELEIGTHTGNHGDTQISPVHQGNTVHETECRDETKIDLADDLLLLLGSECVDAIIVELGLSGVDALDLGGASLLVDERHGDGDVIGKENVMNWL